MLTDGHHRPGSVKMGYFALRFLFVNILHKDWPKEFLPKPKVHQTLPEVLSEKEVYQIISHIKNFKHRTIIMLIYATGARVSECVNLKLTDINSKRMVVNIQEGKGLKQREVPLPIPLLNMLRNYFRAYKPAYYLFEGAGGKGTHIGVAAVREICKKVRYQVPNIKTEFTPHTFRHCFATHHLNHGTNLLVIQRLMGHSDLRNTLKYLHVQQFNENTLFNPISSLDNLDQLCSNQ